jgi:hypothetical protein
MLGLPGRIGWRIIMDDEIKTVTLEEITPNKLDEIDEQLQNIRLRDITMASLNKLAERRKRAEQELINIDAEAQMRAMRAHLIGFSSKDIAS